MRPKKENVQAENEDTINRPNGFGYRHLQFLLYFTGITTNSAIRSDLSVGIVAMTDGKTNPNFEPFDWDEPTKGLILSSFFWGYIISQIPGGIVAHIFGAKYLFLSTALISSILTAFTPLVATLGWEYICVIRVFTGFSQGFAMPSVMALMARWIHPSERHLSAIVMVSNTFGTFVMMIFSGVIAKSNLGWPGIFYLSAAVGILWSILWLIFGSESPSNHKFISKEEQTYLANIGVNSIEKLPLPWVQIFTSMPFLSIFLANVAEVWGFFTLMTETPSYMANTLDFDINSSAIWSAIPYLCKVISTILMSVLSDFLINRQYLSRIVSRKLFNSLSTWIPTVCMIGLGFVTKETSSVAISLFIISFIFNAGSNAGHMLNHMDIAPNFAGTLFGLTNGIANIFAILGPIFVGLVVTDQTDPMQWRIVFFVTAGFYFIGNLIFVIFAKGTIQHWNEKKI